MIIQLLVNFKCTMRSSSFLFETETDFDGVPVGSDHGRGHAGGTGTPPPTELNGSVITSKIYTGTSDSS